MNRIVAMLLWLVVCGCAQQGEPTYTFSELLYPGATETVAVGINEAGTVVGWYRHAKGTTGFVYANGTFRPVDYPSAVLTQLTGIASNGDIVGAYRKADETEELNGQRIAFHGFLLTNTDEFLDVGHPQYPYGMNQRILPDGTIVGCYHERDWVKTMRGITIPRHAITSSGVRADAIAVVNRPGSMNNGGTTDGKIVGSIMDDTGQAYVIDRGELTTFAAPGAVRTEAWDINPSGVVAGVFVDSASVNHGFVSENGKFTTIDFPGASGTVTFGINSRADVVGSFRAAGGQRRGYIARRN